MVRVRSCCECHTLHEINETMTDAQRKRIETTPFKFFLDMPKKLDISKKLLKVMLAKWDDHSDGFRVRDRVVSFSPLDVCFGLGLRIVGEKVKFEDDHYRQPSHTRNLFGKRDLNIKKVKELLGEYQGNDAVDDYCRIYILIGFAEFLFPRTKHLIEEKWFGFVDNLDSLDHYSWGNAVYDDLHSCLCAAATGEAKNESQVHIKGCAVLLQVDMHAINVKFFCLDRIG